MRIALDIILYLGIALLAAFVWGLFVRAGKGK